MIERERSFFVVCVGDRASFEPLVLTSLAPSRAQRSTFDDDDLPWAEVDRADGAIVSCGFANDALPNNAVSRFNVGRERLRDDDVRVLLWLSLAQLEAFVRQAPDLWSYRTTMFHFVSRHDFAKLAARPADKSSELSYQTRLDENTRQLALAPAFARPRLLVERSQIAHHLGRERDALAAIEEAERLLATQAWFDEDFMLEWGTRQVQAGRVDRVTAQIEALSASSLDPLRAWVVMNWKLNRAHALSDLREERRVIDDQLRFYDSHPGVRYRVQVPGGTELVNFAGTCVNRGRLTAALVAAEQAAQRSTQSDGQAFAPMVRSYVHSLRAAILRSRWYALDALREDHLALDLRQWMQASSLQQTTCEAIARSFDALGLLHDKDLFEQQARDLATSHDSYDATDEEPTPLSAARDAMPWRRLERAIDRVKELESSSNDAELDQALAAAQRAWDEDDEEYRSLHHGADLALSSARRATQRGEPQRALDGLLEWDRRLDAEMLRTPQFRVLLEIARASDDPATDAVRESAARRALELAERAEYPAREAEAHAALAALAKARGDEARRALHQGTSEEITAQLAADRAAE